MVAKCSQKDQSHTVKLLLKEKKKQVPINVFCELKTNNKERLCKEFRHPTINQAYNQVKWCPQANYSRTCSYCSNAL